MRCDEIIGLYLIHIAPGFQAWATASIFPKERFWSFNTYRTAFSGNTFVLFVLLNLSSGAPQTTVPFTIRAAEELFSPLLSPRIFILGELLLIMLRTPRLCFVIAIFHLGTQVLI